MTRRYEFTDEQFGAIGELVTEHWGADIQTGIVLDGDDMGLPYLWATATPAARPRRFVIHVDGTVVEDGP